MNPYKQYVKTDSSKNLRGKVISKLNNGIRDLTPTLIKQEDKKRNKTIIETYSRKLTSINNSDKTKNNGKNTIKSKDIEIAKVNITKIARKSKKVCVSNKRNGRSCNNL